MTQSISTSVNLEWIQSIRLMHALAESEYPVYLPQSEEWKFRELRKQFSITFLNDPGKTAILDAVSIDHAKPLVSIGGINRSLLFPNEILVWCRSQWPLVPKDVHVSFCGLVTTSRRKVLNKWMGKQKGPVANISLARVLYSKLTAKLFGHRVTRRESTFQLSDGLLLLWFSTRGRVYPVKAWDEDYFQVLLRSQFVLCPSGDYVWSYRFFEAIMCGAIPIVESSCEAYEGFSFLTMEDTVGDWSLEVAQKNYELCRSRITISAPELNQAISELLQIKHASAP